MRKESTCEISYIASSGTVCTIGFWHVRADIRVLFTCGTSDSPTVREDIKISIYSAILNECDFCVELGDGFKFPCSKLMTTLIYSNAVSVRERWNFF